MTEKIKLFFRKTKTNAKFMNAGRGYKLTDSTSTIGSTSAVEPIKRVEPTEEAKVAGQAALARLEAGKSNTKRFNTSYAAIKAQVKRELEQENRVHQEAQKSHEQVVEKEKSTREDNSLFAITNVYYRCPYLSNEILTKDEWKMKIREFLYEQLNGEERGLIACLIIQNCNFNKEKIDACVEVLGKYLDNIISNPEEDKYKKIRMQNRIFQDKVLPVEGALQFLNAAGFHQEKLLNNDKEEDFLVWNAEKCSIEDITMLMEALKSAERIPLELDRNLQVLLPSQVIRKIDLPPSFFNLTIDEIKNEQQQRTQTIQVNQMLRTKAMREREQEKKYRKYKFSLLRVKFPDNLVLQGTFSVDETFQSVVNFVSENLIDSAKSFSLITPPDLKYNEDCYNETLLKLGLCPTATLIFVQQNNSVERGHKDSTGYLKEELLSIIRSV